MGLEKPGRYSQAKGAAASAVFKAKTWVSEETSGKPRKEASSQLQEDSGKVGKQLRQVKLCNIIPTLHSEEWLKMMLGGRRKTSQCFWDLLDPTNTFSIDEEVPGDFEVDLSIIRAEVTEVVMLQGWMNSSG